MMEKMKSALEIALERAKNIEESFKEKQDPKEMEQEKYLKAARTMGRSLLQGKMQKEAVKETIGRYPEESREKALKAFFDEVTAKMNLTNTPLVLQAISFLTEEEKIKSACQEFEKHYHQYIKNIKEKGAELQENIGKTMLKKLHREGIKGSAVAGFNIKHLPQWKKALEQLQEEYKNILPDFRRAILSK